MKDAISVLSERGFIQQCTDLEGLKKQLDKERTTFYCGFDPTGPSLHAGHMIPLFAMAHMVRAGHKAIALAGGGTARIGDPSGKTEMRKILPVDTIKENSRKIQKQMERFLDFENENAILLDNAEWLADLNYIDFLREIGRHFSVNRMLSFEAYKMRLETGLSFIEFNYQLLQSYDFLILQRNQNCKLQIGGDDQWGNIVAGADLIRRVDGQEAFGLTFPLISRADGKKMGKTEKGALFLDPEMTSPYEFFQYWRNIPDPDVEKFLFAFTFLEVDEIKKLSKLSGSDINTAKDRFAFEITKIVHGENEAEKAQKSSHAAFQGGESKDKSSIPSAVIKVSELNKGISALDLFALSDLCASKSEARRLIQQGGATVSGKKVESLDNLIDRSWSEDGEIMLKAGKKRYFRVIIDG
jgi:tyrosyl-tRNA synthetase